MENYTPPFHITNEMLMLISSISEKLGKISITNPLAAKPHLRKNNRIRSIHSSLKIEANSLSFTQVRDVIGGRLVLGEQKEILEVKNAYAAYDRITDIDPYSIDDLLTIHFVMTNGLVKEAGVFRSGEEGVFNGDTCIFMAPPAKMVPSLMNDLFSFLERSKKEVHPLILASIFHYEFVFIHPFSDGNGRMARLWHTALLSQWNPIFEYVPLESQIEKFQDEYYDAIAKCHIAGNSDSFIRFILEKVNLILDELMVQIRDDADISEYVKKLLAVMEYNTPYTLDSLMEKVGIRSKESFRKHYLQEAMSLGLVKMTLPDKPKSKNQRYIRV